VPGIEPRFSGVGKSIEDKQPIAKRPMPPLYHLSGKPMFFGNTSKKKTGTAAR
jgi:hypothetical protein